MTKPISQTAMMNFMLIGALLTTAEENGVPVENILSPTQRNAVEKLAEEMPSDEETNQLFFKILFDTAREIADRIVTERENQDQ